MPEVKIDAKEIGRIIKQRREERGMSGDEVAALCGMSRSTYYRIESGNGKTMNFASINKIATVLNMEIDPLTGAVKNELANEADELTEIVKQMDEKDKSLLKRILQLSPPRLDLTNHDVCGILRGHSTYHEEREYYRMR